VAAAESIETDEATLGLVARAARGSFRDAVSTLDQLATATSGRILPDDARALLGTVEEATLLAVVDQVVAQDTPARSATWTRWPRAARTSGSSSRSCSGTCGCCS
jgi:DNA polymerase-3 subunit gamma/tau